MLPFDAQTQPLVVWEHLKDHRILLLGLVRNRTVVPKRSAGKRFSTQKQVLLARCREIGFAAWYAQS